ncbi:ISAs1 family transposase [Streptomyces sp. enrichment culture]|uniref:ISAs1 family transposase n=1 Tax=Streptomyces sp. enrichment culture TaxID=1795815 RepID=UPI00308EA628|nr:ISAs1 family transposase [Streptomyces cellulosae]WSB88656.1 ISAs1 family transposase [Streptomyces cellulosae]
MLEKLGPLDADRIADLCPYLASVPDPRSRRGRWYSLVSVLLVCACAAVSGAKSLDEIAEFAERATNTLLATLGIRRHLLGWRRSPKPVTIGRVLMALDGDALDQAVGAYLADQHRKSASADAPAARPQRVIAVDGKALKGSARLDAPRRHLLAAVTHHPVATLAQVEVGAKTNETRHFKPLLAPLHLADAVVTFDALHSVKANITWLVETKKAHYIAVIKTNQPTAYAQLAALPWTSIKVQHTASATAHGRRESRSIKTCSIADNLGGIAFPHARLAIRVHRRRKPTGKPESRESVYAVTSLDIHQTSPADLAAAIRGHWGIENSSHYIRDVTFAEDASTVHTDNAPRAMATFRNLAIGTLKILGADNIAKTTRAIRHEPERALAILGITNNPDTHGT